MPVPYPGELATASKSFGSIDKRWLAFGGLSTNKTSAINGDKHFIFYSSRVFHYTRMQADAHKVDRSRRKGSSGSSRNPTVINVAPSARFSDPFLSSAAELPADPPDSDEVFEVCESLATPDIPLWTPTTNPDKDAQVFRHYKGRCLNCHGMNQLLQNCAQPFINAINSGCIIPQLGQLGDNGKTYRRCQRSMQTYHRPTHVGGENTRSSPSSYHRKNSSRRYDNNRRNNGLSNSGHSHHGAPQL